MMKSEQHNNNNKISGLHSSEPSIKPLPSASQTSSNKKKYKGVRMRSWGSWVSEIRAPNQKTRIWLGSYSTPEAAARAYDAALLCLKGSSASNLINFPLNAPYYYHYIPPLNHDNDVNNNNNNNNNANMIMSPKSIQRVAAAAANATTMFPSANHHQEHYHGTPSSTTLPSTPLLTSSPVSDLGFFVEDFMGGDDNGTPMAMVNDPWIDLSPKYLDPMMNGMFFNPPSMTYVDEVYEEGDFSLWSFY